TTGADPTVLLRMKEDYDGAEPTASSVSALNLIALSHLVDDAAWTMRIERTFKYFGPRLEQLGRGVPMMAAALSAWTAGIQQVVLVGEAGRSELERAVARRYLPFGIVLSLSAEQQRHLGAELGFVRRMKPIDGRAAAYVCRDFTCRQPVTTVEEMERSLAGPHHAD